MEKHCKQCGAYMKCLKTGIQVDINGEGRTGDLFGCPFCGELSIFGSPKQSGGYETSRLHAKVTSAIKEGEVPDDYNYDIFHFVRLDSSPGFLDHMKQWNQEYFQKNEEKLK